MAGRSRWQRFAATQSGSTSGRHGAHLVSTRHRICAPAYEAHRTDGLVLIAIDVQEESGVVRDYVTRYGLSYTIGLDVTGAVFHTYRVFGLPTQYFVDRNGLIRDRVLGPLDRAGMERKLGEIINP